MIELLILGLLKEEPLHGYKLKRRLERLIGYFGVVSYGSLYPMLHKLEERGQVLKTVEEQRGLSRNVYSLTSKGEARFLDLMQDSSVPLMLKMIFFQTIPSAERKRLLELQWDQWSRKLVECSWLRRIAGHNPYRVALLMRSIDHLERDLAWIEKLIGAENLP